MNNGACLKTVQLMFIILVVGYAVSPAADNKMDFLSKYPYTDRAINNRLSPGTYAQCT